MVLMTSKSVKVKTCVELLTKLLKCVGFSHYAAEDFRLAKFDDTRAYGPMLHLLFEITYFIKYRCIDNSCLAAYEKFPQKAVLDFVSNELSHMGYPRLCQNLLTVSSRELLLAVLWLFRYHSLLLSFANSIYGDLSSVFDQLSYLSSQKLTNSQNFKKDTFEIDGSSPSHVADIRWYFGRLLVRMKELHQTRMAVVNRASRCNQTLGISTNWKSTEMQLRERIHTIKMVIQKLDLLFSWASSSSTFWRWAVSVLEANQREVHPVESWARFSEDLDSAIHRLDISVQRLLTIAGKFETLPDPPEQESLNVEIDNIPIMIMDEINTMREELHCAFTPDLFVFTPIHFRYVVLTDKLSEVSQSVVLGEPLRTMFKLKIENRRLGLLIETAKQNCGRLRLALSRELQDWAEVYIPGTLFIYNPATRLPESTQREQM